MAIKSPSANIAEIHKNEYFYTKKMLETPTVEAEKPIDVIIPWVDGDDPEHQKKREGYLGKVPTKNIPGAHHTRFGSINEIKYAVLSILTFAPFIRKIFILTDGQDPRLDKDIQTYFPERLKDVKIIDHKEIFRGYEEFLPTFNSRSIENLLWRVEGLAENFVYFNDDLFLIKKCRPEDWFIKNRPVLRGNWLPVPVLRRVWNKLQLAVNSGLLHHPNFQLRPSFHTGQWHAAKVLGFRWKYFYFGHTPHPINSRRLQKFYLENPDLLKKNLTPKFRDHHQFNVISLAYHLELLQGNKNLAPKNLAYLQPRNRPENYLEKKIKQCEADPDIKFMCVQSLESCSREDQNRVLGWMDKILNL
ncbi:MAG: Stealth CR1 domain-containing protein [Cyclobacteriaceae bacterium]